MPNPVDLPLLPVPLQVQAPGYAALDIRRAVTGSGPQEGVLGDTDFLVTPRFAGASQAVDVAAGEALVRGDSITRQGLYHCALEANLTGITQVDVPGADSVKPRIDQAVLEVKDDTHDASGLFVARVRVVPGTPTTGATLTNRLGVAPLPATSLLLADLYSEANEGQIVTTDIRDRRAWAHGAFVPWHAVGQQASFNQLPRRRLETSGRTLRVTLRARDTQTGSTATYIKARALIDGVQPAAADGGASQEESLGRGFFFEWLLTNVPSGTHLVELDLEETDGSWDALDVTMSVEEITRPIAHNGLA